MAKGLKNTMIYNCEHYLKPGSCLSLLRNIMPKRKYDLIVFSTSQSMFSISISTVQYFCCLRNTVQSQLPAFTLKHLTEEKNITAGILNLSNKF